jgi:hypothetical protein
MLLMRQRRRREGRRDPHAATTPVGQTLEVHVKGLDHVPHTRLLTPTWLTRGRSADDQIGEMQLAAAASLGTLRRCATEMTEMIEKARGWGPGKGADVSVGRERRVLQVQLPGCLTLARCVAFVCPAASEQPARLTVRE